MHTVFWFRHLRQFCQAGLAASSFLSPMLVLRNFSLFETWVL